ncbi:HNH endonuclease [Candidatus Sumerlaeota bacterium]|nr:HNH endonuclease [Candidatus Sumerlaeota bacterium]
MLSQGVLVLNKNWMAVHVCSVRRAISLVCQDMARVVASDYQIHDFDSWRMLSQHIEIHGNQYIHTPKFRILVPEVILLTGFNRMPPRAVKFNRRNIYMRDHYTCQYCGVRPDKESLTIDHVVPRSRGGRSTWENVVLACQSCNSKKGSHLHEEVGMHLAHTPKRPHWMSTLRNTLKGPDRPIWQKFVDVAYWNVALEEE